MREILFRGKREDNGKWVEGYYGQFHNRPIHEGENSHQIFVPMEDATVFGSMIGGLWHEVVPETVGQYTGLIDKNRKKIFEGDIVDYKNNVVRFGKHDIGCCGCCYDSHQTVGFYISDADDAIARADEEAWEGLEVIGNIYDNPELAKGGAE